MGEFVKKSVFDRIWTNILTYSGVEILLGGAAFGFLKGGVETLARTETGRFCDCFYGGFGQISRVTQLLLDVGNPVIVQIIPERNSILTFNRLANGPVRIAR